MATKNNSKQATITKFGLQSGTDNTLYAMWDWSRGYTDKYLVKWEYCAGGIWFSGSSSSNSVDSNDPAASRQSTYSIPSNATCVRFSVKPVSKTKGTNTKRSYWTANWSTVKRYDVTQKPPIAPGTPSPTVEKYKLTAILENLSLNADVINFQVVKRNGAKFVPVASSQTTIQYATSADRAAKENGYARYSCNLNAGGEYKVRARSSRDGIYSDWSDYSGSVFTSPATPSNITEIRATSETAVYLEWPSIDGATSYDIEYTTETNYFDGSNQTTTETGIEFNHYELTGLETGKEYFFRVRAVRDSETSPWSTIRSVILGKEPAAPTTWSSTTTAIVGETINLYWVHNSEDGSSQTYAHLLVYDEEGVAIVDRTIANSTEEDEKDKTSVYALETASVPRIKDGSILKWKVQTRGITNMLSEWSIERTIEVYEPVTVALTLENGAGEIVEEVTSFPIYVKALAEQNRQTPIGYHVSIIANESYESVDNVGNDIFVSQGDEIYSKYYDTTENPLELMLLPSSVTLENNISYTMTCTVSMSSGLSGEASYTFTVAWSEDSYWPDAEVGIDTETYTATILPYCEEIVGVDDNGDDIYELVGDVTLAVYRREFDGRFTELISGVENTRSVQITDPHPALDYARYRIIATSNTTGAVGYYDLPGYEVGGKAVIIQWGEVWSNFDTPENAETVDPSWSGSMLKLPYNIDVSDSHKPDVSLIEYIGREHPISYYGTQLGVSSSWSMEIEKNDEETLYALRRLSRWMGDAYVREPSGSGYWANVTVSFSQKHGSLTIPVTLEITRVEGGI